MPAAEMKGRAPDVSKLQQLLTQGAQMHGSLALQRQPCWSVPARLSWHGAVPTFLVTGAAPTLIPSLPKVPRTFRRPFVPRAV